MCQQLCALVGSVGFVCLRHLSCIPCPCLGFSPMVSSCWFFVCTRVCLPQGPLSLCLRSFFLWFWCDTLFALFRDCLASVILTTVTDITSTVGSGATVSTYSQRVTTPWRSVVKMTSRTVLGHVRLEGVNNNNKDGGLKCTCLMIRRESQIGGIKHTCLVTTMESRSGVGEGPHLLIRQKPQVNLVQKKIDASRFKEIDNLLKLNALSGMSPEESDHFAKTTPENIIPTNMMDKCKLQDDGTVAAKSRSVLVGWKDPMIYQLERAAPTPTQEGIMVTLQWLASATVTGRIADLTNAFRQARKTSRKNKLATKTATGCDSSRGGTTTVVACGNRDLWTCVRTKLVESKLDRGIVGCRLCQKSVRQMLVHILFSSDETSEGQMSLDVDDFIEGGKETHRKTMEGFYDKYRCGKAVDLMSAGKEGTQSRARPRFSHHCVDGRICQVQAPSHWSSKRILVKHQRDKWWDAHERQGSQWWFGLAGINSKTRHGGASLDHSVWVWPTIAATVFRSQRGSETMSRSSHHHYDLAHSFRGAALDDIHRLRFRHRRATATPTRLVSVCHQQVFQPRTIGASECASLAESEAHTKA